MLSDPFSLLGVPARFDLTPESIRRAYLARVAAVHPDHAAEEGATPNAAELNAAMKSLLDPEARAAALLARLGGPSKEENRTLPDGFLMDMMAWRESIDEAMAAGNRRAVAAALAEAGKRRDGHIATATTLFESVSTAPSPAQLTFLRRELNAWRYIERLIEQVSATQSPVPGQTGGGGIGPAGPATATPDSP